MSGISKISTRVSIRLPNEVDIVPFYGIIKLESGKNWL
jgi:hypothetical protein